MRPHTRAATPILTGLMLLACTATPIDAQFQFGPHGSFSTENELGVGARAVVGLGPMFDDTETTVLQELDAVVAFDRFFPATTSAGSYEFETDWWEINANISLPFPDALGESSGLAPYAGLGLSYANASIEVTQGQTSEQLVADSGTAGNLLAGLTGGPWFGEARYRAAEDPQLILTVGLLLGS